PMVAGSSVMLTLGRCRDSSVLSIASPRSRMAARGAPRAMKVTSAPPRTSRAPKKPPTPPDPMTAMGTAVLLAPTAWDLQASQPGRPRRGGWPARGGGPPTILEGLTETPHIEADRIAGGRGARPGWSEGAPERAPSKSLQRALKSCPEF